MASIIHEMGRVMLWLGPSFRTEIYELAIADCERANMTKTGGSTVCQSESSF